MFILPKKVNILLPLFQIKYLIENSTKSQKLFNFVRIGFVTIKESMIIFISNFC
jgi:hypothetical protein